MNSEQQNNSPNNSESTDSPNTIDTMLVDRSLLDRLYKQGKLSDTAYNYALELINPVSTNISTNDTIDTIDTIDTTNYTIKELMASKPIAPLNSTETEKSKIQGTQETQEIWNAWKTWLSNGLLILGLSLILVGTVYFFAFNWNIFSILEIFTILQIGLFFTLFAVYKFGLTHLSGKLSLLASTVLVGVLLATFGQKYQIGADSYTLFMTWSILTLAWTLVSCFAVQYFLWLVITNLGIAFWWVQAAPPFLTGDDMGFMIIIYMSVFNLIILALREYAVHVKGVLWLQSKWTSLVIILGILTALLVPSIWWLLDAPYSQYIPSLTYCMVFNAILHTALYIYYRYIHFDIAVLTSLFLSLGIMLEFVIVRVIFDFLNLSTSGFFYMAILGVGIFTLLINHLRHIPQARKV